MTRIRNIIANLLDLCSALKSARNDFDRHVASKGYRLPFLDR